jgi:hypothetical protein
MSRFRGKCKIGEVLSPLIDGLGTAIDVYLFSLSHNDGVYNIL